MTETESLWRCAARTDTGKVRARNEDAFLALPEKGLWAVADGMGGHQNGALASRLIVEHLAELPHESDIDLRLKQIRQCLHVLNRRLSQELTVTAEQPDPVIGSTVVALLIEGERAVCVWAGDSRCYLWRGGTLFQLSRDHSLLQQLIQEQQCSPKQAASHPSAHALTRAVGASEKLVLEVVEFTVYPGDTLLLCSDGLYQGMSADHLGSALGQPSARLAVQKLFDQALNGPARDNLSAVVIRR
ncbi:MAG TPA: serine/threonine-protein phosphatase [Pseudomonas xinjiangensis]|uniref:Serine/threonine-protein phosphatase n=2 Tax=root TaxID=1 RepID=A0A7V1BRB6_9GAMM|nr:serine/threonine-protein phosphatase [Halopseudomonas xinjiangensis]HEC47830.1 serine/threonine-protein phosphatase [Halopseudomonas xinjiangensis]